MQFISSWNISLAGGSKIKMGSSLLSSSFHPIISEVVGRHHRNLSCFPDACLEDTPFEMLIQSITRWGILPISLVFCENTLNQTRSTSLSSFDSLEYTQQTKVVAASISHGDIWNGVLIIVAHSSIRDGTSCINFLQYCLALNLKEDVPRFMAIVFNEIILVDFHALKEIRISAADFRALM